MVGQCLVLGVAAIAAGAGGGSAGAVDADATVQQGEVREVALQPRQHCKAALRPRDRSEEEEVVRGDAKRVGEPREEDFLFLSFCCYF